MLQGQAGDTAEGRSLLYQITGDSDKTLFTKVLRGSSVALILISFLWDGPIMCSFLGGD